MPAESSPASSVGAVSMRFASTLRLLQHERIVEQEQCLRRDGGVVRRSTMAVESAASNSGPKPERSERIVIR